MSATSSDSRVRRTTGAMFLIGALSFGTAATVLSSTFNWPDILREPGSVVLPAFADGGPSLVWTWFATAWTYAILVVPILLRTVSGLFRSGFVRRLFTEALVVGATTLLTKEGALDKLFGTKGETKALLKSNAEG